MAYNPKNIFKDKLFEPVNKKMLFFENGYTLGSQKEMVAFLGNFLHSECTLMYPVYTTFENSAKYDLGKKLGQFL